MKIFQKILFLSFLILPLVDQLYQLEEKSPAVLIRAGVTVLMTVMLVRLLLKHKDRKNGAIVRTSMILLIYIAVVTIIVEGGFSSFYAYVKIAYPLIGLLFIYFYTKYSVLDEKFFITIFFLIIVLYGIISFLNIGIRMDYGRGLSIADNTGYTLVTILPAVFLISKKKWMFATSLFIIILGAIICGKRGALLALAVALIPISRYILTIYSKGSIKSIIFVIFTILAILITINWFGTFINATILRFQSLEDDGGSGRDMIYQLYFDHYAMSDPLHQIFGHGLHAGQFGKNHRFAFIPLLAHNDWLEMLFDFGIVGICIFVTFFYNMFIMIRRSRRNKDAIYYMLVVSLLVMVFKSVLSSTFLMTPNTIYLFMLLAYAIAKLEQRLSMKTYYKTVF